MEILHSEDEIKHFDNLGIQAQKLSKIGKIYNNQELLNLAALYKTQIKKELAKYKSFINKKALAPPSNLTERDVPRLGRIKGKFYFNAYSKAVRCDFKYEDGGFNSHSVKELIETV